MGEMSRTFNFNTKTLFLLTIPSKNLKYFQTRSLDNFELAVDGSLSDGLRGVYDVVLPTPVYHLALFWLCFVQHPADGKNEIRVAMLVS